MRCQVDYLDAVGEERPTRLDGQSALVETGRKQRQDLGAEVLLQFLAAVEGAQLLAALLHCLQ